MAIHIDGDGNFYFGASGTADFANIQYIPDFSVTKDGVVTANSGTIGGIDLASDHIKSSNYSAISGQEDGFRINSNGNAVFNDVTIRGDLKGVELIGDFIFNGGTFKTSNSGTRVEITDNNQTEGEIRFETSSGTVARLVGDSTNNTDLLFEQASLSGGKIRLITGVTSTGLELNGNEVNFATPLGSSNPVIKLNGTNANSAGTSTLSKLLGVDSSGRLSVGSATSGVSSISVTGELQLSGSGGVLNINHNDSDHDNRYYTETEVNTLLGNKDNYGSWTAKAGGNDMTVQSGYGVEWKAGSGISMSVNTSPYEITFSHGSGTHVSSSTAVQALFPGGIRGSVTLGSGTTGRFFNGIGQSGQNYTWDTTTTFNGTPTFSGTINVGSNIFHPTPNDGNGFIGFSSNRFNRVYASNGVSTTSDERLKENIENIPFGLDYLNSLRPVQFEWMPKYIDECTICGCTVEDGNDNCGNCWEDVTNEEGEIIDKTYCECETTSVDITGNKKLWGFIAQELIETPPEPDIDIELVDYDSEEDSYNMNYPQLIAPLVKAVQELSTQISDLTARVEALEG
jgi:hypothetical protein